MGVFSAQTSSWFFETVTFEGQRRFDYLNGNLYAYHPDALGTMRLATLKDGSVSGDTLLYPWGQSWTSSGSPTNLFAGFQNWDGNVPMYVGQFRAYPVNYGRWLTPDPAGKKAVRLDDPQTWNAYAYVRNNPTTLTDPSGLLTPAGGADPFESTHVYTGTIESFDQGTEERPAGEKAEDQQQKEPSTPGQEPSWDKSKPLPDDPSKLGPDWKPEPKHDPQGKSGDKRYVNDKTGDKLDWHKGQPGEKNWPGKDHWHWVPGGQKDKSHYRPGDTVNKIGIVAGIGAAIRVIIETAPEWLPELGLAF